MNKKKALLITLAVFFAASVAAATVPTKQGPFVMYLLSDDLTNTVHGIPPCDTNEGSNPGNEKCGGNAGENPNGDDVWGDETNGTSQ